MDYFIPQTKHTLCIRVTPNSIQRKRNEETTTSLYVIR
jgi:hypothetical protein